MLTPSRWATSVSLVLLMAGCGKGADKNAEAQAACADMQSKFASASLTLAEYRTAVSMRSAKLPGTYLPALMYDYCPAIVSAGVEADSAESLNEVEDTVILGQVPAQSNPSPSPSKSGGGLTCAQRYAAADNPMFTEEEKESLRLGVDVDCNPDRVKDAFK